MIDEPVFGLDMSTLHGSQPLGTIFSRKSSDDPWPIAEARVTFCNGSEVARVAFPPKEETLQSQMILARELSFSVLKAHTANYSSRFLEECTVSKASENRTLMKRHQTASRGGQRGPPFDGQHQQIPAWLAPRSPTPTAQGGHISGTMPCLTHHSQRLKEALGESGGKLSVVRVTHVLCPYMLSRTQPVSHVHSSNGILVGTSEDTPNLVYSKCLHCKLPDELCADVKIIAKEWVVLTESEVDRLLRLATAATSSGDNMSLPCLLFD